MKSNNPQTGCAEVLRLAEAQLDARQLPQTDSRVAAHLLVCARCRTEIEHAVEMQTALWRFGEKPCPSEVSRTVLRAARNERRKSLRRAAHNWLLQIRKRYLQPAIISLSLAALITTAAIFWRMRSNSLTAEPTAEEISQAQLDIKWTLAYLGGLGKMTGRIMEKNVIGTEVVAPLQHAFESIIAKQSTTQK